MKKLLALLLTGLLLCSAALADTVVTSFYPIYLFTLNLTDGIEGLEVKNLAAPGTGCLHDYQLSTADMKALSRANAFLINGAGMESYLTMVFEAFPELPVTDASEGIELLPDEDGETAYNPHVWLDPANAQVMVTNLAAGLTAVWPQYAEAVNANRDAYLARLAALDAELEEGLAPLAGQSIITFHEAFPYFANAYGLEVGAVIVTEANESISPRRLAELITLVEKLGNPPLFTEPQYQDIIAQTISAQTGAPVYELDPCVSAPDGADHGPLTQYEDTMRANLRTLLEAFAAD